MSTLEQLDQQILGHEAMAAGYLAMGHWMFTDMMRHAHMVLVFRLKSKRQLLKGRQES